MNQRYLHIFFALGRPFSPIYALGMSLRQKAYQCGLFHVHRVDRPVISIGNICLGGTGKTPHVIAMAHRLRAEGLRPAIVSRGYGGRAGSGPVVVSDGETCLSQAETCGDEPFMMASSLSGVPVIVGSNRFACAQTAIKRFDATVILLDDGFQHMALFRDLDIVLLPAKAPFGTRNVFPGGDLREPINALKRASAIILTKCEQVPGNSLDLIKTEVRKESGSIPIFSSYTCFSRIRMATGARAGEKSSNLPVYCFCAIAMPEPFAALVAKQGMAVVGEKFFEDHHQFSKEELEGVFVMARRAGAKMILTTAKDFARIQGLWRSEFKGRKDIPPLGIVEIDVEIEPSFYSFVHSRLA